MTRVALVTNGIASTLNTGLELARRLQERGHEVTVVSHADVGPVVAGEGIAFVRLTADRDAFAELHALVARMRDGSWTQRAAAAGRFPRAMWRARRSTVRADELLDAIRSIDPGLLVIDIEEHVAIAATRRLAIPTALTTFLFAIEERPGVPPMDSWSRPNDTDRSARSLGAEWERVRREKRAARRRRRRTMAVVTDRLGPVSYRSTSPTALRAVARRAGFDLAVETDADHWLRPYGYRRLPVLSTNLRELEFGAGGEVNWNYVGTMVRTDRQDAVAGAASRAAWEAVLERRRSIVGDKEPPSLVYCSLGSYWSTDVRLLRKVVEVARRHPEWDVVVGLGGAGDPAALGTVPANVTTLGWAPQVEVLGQADVAIVHGGNASLNECLATGTPMVVCSTGHLDQNGVAARVDEFGLGVGHAGDEVTADEIEESLVRCLHDADIRATVDRLHRLATSDVTSDVAVDFLEALVVPGRERAASD